MSKQLNIILLLLGLISHVNVARAQQVQPYKPMTESEWNEAKKGFSDNVLLEINKLNFEPNHVFGENAYFVRYNTEDTTLFDFHKLRKIVSKDELMILTDHPNAIIRCYAFLAISYLSNIDFLSIIEKHITDEEIVITTSDFIDGYCHITYNPSKNSVGDIMIAISTPDDEIICSECKYMNSLDRYILYQKLIDTDNNLNSKYLAWLELHPSEDNLDISYLKKRITNGINRRSLESMLNLGCKSLDHLPDSSFNLFCSQLSLLSDSVISYLLNKRVLYSSVFNNNYRLNDTASINKISELAKKISINELEILTDAPFPTMRCLAFCALSMHENYNLLPILAKHINDEGKTTLLMESIPVNEVYVLIASRSLEFPMSAYIPYPHLFSEIDSVIIMFSNKANSIILGSLIVLPLRPYFEVKLRDLAQNGQAYDKHYTVVALAKYQNLADTSLIITHRKNIKKGELDFELNLDAIEKFRHPYFLPYIKKYFYKGNIEVAYIYPLQEFLPIIKVNLQKQLKLNDKNAIAGILEILLAYGTTPYKKQAKDIVSLVYQYHSNNKSNFTNISLFKDWGVSHLKHLTYFININFNFNFMRHSEEKDSMFIDFYNKEEFETILWKTWENYHIVTYQEYTYLKNIDNERSLKLGYLTLVKVLTDTGYTYYENPNNYFDTYTYRSPLLPIAYDVINKYSYKQVELLPSIKHKLLNNLSKGRNTYFPLNFLIVYKGTPHHEDAKKIAALSFINELPNQQKFIGEINFLRWCSSTTSKNTSLQLPNEKTFAYKSDYKSLDTLFLYFYSKEEVEGIVWKIWETDHVITQYLFEYLTNKNKSKAHVYAKNSITSIINDRKGTFLDRMHIEDHNMKQDYRHVIEDWLRVMNRNYPDTLFELLNKDLEKPSLAIHALNKFIGFLPSNTETEWSKKFNYIDKLIIRLQQESDFKTAAVLVFTLLNHTKNLEPIRRRIIKAYTNNEHFKNNKKAQQEFSNILYSNCSDYRAWYRKLILDY